MNIAQEISDQALNPLLNRNRLKCFIIVCSVAAMIPPAYSETRRMTSEIRADARTGRLVRKTTVSGPARSSRATAESNLPLRQMIESIAVKNEVEPSLVYSVIRAESGYNPLAVSPKGAQGLMQLIPSTARRFGVNDSFDSKENVEGGVRYLRYLMGLFHGDYTRAIAAYNAGEGAVAKFGGVPPYKETQNYVAQVARHLEAERRTYVPVNLPVDSGLSSDTTTGASETYNPVIASVNPDGSVSYRTP